MPPIRHGGGHSSERSSEFVTKLTLDKEMPALAGPPDLVVLDLMVPGRPTGLELLRQLRLFARRDTLPTIIASALLVTEEARAEFNRAAGQSVVVLTKPYDLDVLTALVWVQLGAA